MKKNMYSLMLSENVVSAIDKLAYEAGTNRSNMINNILAEYVSYRTPEMRIKQMFEMMENLLSPDDGFKVMLRSSDSFFSLRSALTYKYNPTINYSVELYRVMSDTIGQLKASLRTQNNSLKLYIMQFYKLWAKLEYSYSGISDCQIEQEKFTKTLVLRPGQFAPEQISEELLSQGIINYIHTFDTALKAFLYNLDTPAQAIAQVEGIYKKYQKSSHIIL